MRVSKRLAEIRIIQELTQENVVAKMKEKGFQLNASMLSRCESGNRKLTVEEFLALCDIYKVGDIRQTFTGISSVDNNLLDGLNYTGQQHAKKIINLLRNEPMFSATEPPRKQHRYLRLYDLPVSAGFGEYLDSDSYEELAVDDTIPDSAEYAVKISGESMTPRFIDGQIVFVKPQQWLDLGEIGIFSYQNEGYIKIYAGDKLVSLNSHYKPIKLRFPDEFHIFGKVVG